MCRASIVVTMFLACLALCALSCRFPHHLAPSDLRDAPQSELRERLRAELADLDYLPAIASDQTFIAVQRERIYGSSVDLIVLLRPVRCVHDTCTKLLFTYGWDPNNHEYATRDSIKGRNLSAFTAFDLSGSGRADLLLYTVARSRRGMQVVGAPANGTGLVVRLSLDTTIPAIVPWTGHSYGLIEYDSLYARMLSGIPVRAPKRCWVRHGESYEESPADPVWGALVERFRDSVMASASVAAQEMMQAAHPDEATERRFVNASIAAMLADTSWSKAADRLTSLLSSFTTKLSSNRFSALSRIASTIRSGPFIRRANKEAAQSVMDLSDLDDAISVGDSARAHWFVLRINGELHSATTLAEIGAELVQHGILLQDANLVLDHAMQLEPNNPEALRAKARLLDRTGNDVDARALLMRSLQFDSTSQEAHRALHELSN